MKRFRQHIAYKSLLVIVVMLIFDAFYNEFMTERTRRRSAKLKEAVSTK